VGALKKPADKNADVWKAYQQLQTYKEEIADLLVFNEGGGRKGS